MFSLGQFTGHSSQVLQRPNFIATIGPGFFRGFLRDEVTCRASHRLLAYSQAHSHQGGRRVSLKDQAAVCEWDDRPVPCYSGAWVQGPQRRWFQRMRVGRSSTWHHSWSLPMSLHFKPTAAFQFAVLQPENENKMKVLILNEGLRY